jgi:hypothetical protein
MISGSPTLTLGVVGNCQARGVAACMQSLTRHAVLPWAHIGVTPPEDLAEAVAKCDVIFVQHVFGERVDALERRSQTRIVKLPIVTFPAFHPDLIYLRYGDDLADSPLGKYHSSLAFHGWTTGLNLRDTLDLYNARTYQRLGFFSYLDASLAALRQEAATVDMPLETLCAGWLRQGCFMHTVNHPKLFVLADIARAALARVGLEADTPDGPDHVADPLLKGAIWPVYPELASRWGLRGSYQFKVQQVRGSPVRFLDLEAFVARSLRIYATLDRTALSCFRPDFATYGARLNPPPAPAAGTHGDAAPHPYAALPAYRFWRRAVEQVPLADVDPVVRAGFTIAPDDRVATAGSCFAQHIGRRLAAAGCTHQITEPPPPGMSEAQAARSQYGIFSARYGNLYSARQLLQLIDRACGRFVPAAAAWQRSDGRCVDPFRPTIDEAGFADTAALEQSRVLHLQAVRTLFETMDVLVFTLGLTECWRSPVDGAVFPLPPGVAGCRADPAGCEFVNLTLAEVVDDLDTAVRRLRTINPAARVLLTVSPVPLAATYEDRHVLTATTYSKAVLRVAAETLAREHDHVDYFPAYEVITGSFSRGRYFDADLRSVTPEGVDHVMRLFLRHYAQPELAIAGAGNEIQAVSEIVCDEEGLDPA